MNGMALTRSRGGGGSGSRWTQGPRPRPRWGPGLPARGVARGPGPGGSGGPCGGGGGCGPAGPPPGWPPRTGRGRGSGRPVAADRWRTNKKVGTQKSGAEPVEVLGDNRPNRKMVLHGQCCGKLANAQCDAQSPTSGIIPLFAAATKWDPSNLGRVTTHQANPPPAQRHSGIGRIATQKWPLAMERHSTSTGVSDLAVFAQTRRVVRGRKRRRKAVAITVPWGPTNSYTSSSCRSRVATVNANRPMGPSLPRNPQPTRVVREFIEKISAAGCESKRTRDNFGNRLAGLSRFQRYGKT